MIDINPDRLLMHLRALTKFDADDYGVNRVAFAAAVDELISARSNAEYDTRSPHV
jgi:hypothetical protein